MLSGDRRASNEGQKRAEMEVDPEGRGPAGPSEEDADESVGCLPMEITMIEKLWAFSSWDMYYSRLEVRCRIVPNHKSSTLWEYFCAVEIVERIE